MLVALKLSLAKQRPGYVPLGRALGMSISEVHAAIRRLAESQLFDESTQQVRRRPLLEFVLHGLRYVYPAKSNGITRGMPTAWAAPILGSTPLSGIAGGDELAPVWSDPEGLVRGSEVEPLYSSVPRAAKEDPELYALLALVDAIRLGRARERKLAGAELERRLIENGAA